MKTGNKSLKYAIDQALITLGGVGGQKASDATGSAQTPTPSLGALARQLHEVIESHLAAVDGFDAVRVEAIKAAVRSRTLHVDSAVVAERLIASVRELVGK